jgi:GNAT superfamily N-acetyltransferase
MDGGGRPRRSRGRHPKPRSGVGAAPERGRSPAMTKQAHTIERLSLPASDSDLRDLAHLLVDAVESGAAVSFLAPLTLERAEDWWRRAVSGCHSGAIFLVARDAEGIVGTVQLHPAWAPNQPHRAEIVKLLVHRRGRRAGLGTRLMRTIEDAARRGGFSLLTLDAKRGAAAEYLYRQLGWAYAGTIPGFAFDPDGITPHDAVVFYKELSQTEESRAG